MNDSVDHSRSTSYFLRFVSQAPRATSSKHLALHSCAINKKVPRVVRTPDNAISEPPLCNRMLYH